MHWVKTSKYISAKTLILCLFYLTIKYWIFIYCSWIFHMSISVIVKYDSIYNGQWVKTGFSLTSNIYFLFFIISLCKGSQYYTRTQSLWKCTLQGTLQYYSGACASHSSRDQISIFWWQRWDGPTSQQRFGLIGLKIVLRWGRDRMSWWLHPTSQAPGLW